jgi:hypothetical protein
MMIARRSMIPHNTRALADEVEDVVGWRGPASLSLAANYQTFGRYYQ